MFFISPLNKFTFLMCSGIKTSVWLEGTKGTPPMTNIFIWWEQAARGWKITPQRKARVDAKSTHSYADDLSNKYANVIKVHAAPDRTHTVAPTLRTTRAAYQADVRSRLEVLKQTNTNRSVDFTARDAFLWRDDCRRTTLLQLF